MRRSKRVRKKQESLIEEILSRIGNEKELDIEDLILDVSDRGVSDEEYDSNREIKSKCNSKNDKIIGILKCNRKNKEDLYKKHNLMAS